MSGVAGPVTVTPSPQDQIAANGFAWIPASSWSVAPELLAHFESLRSDWDDLEVDRYLASGARFRLRRYGRFHWSPPKDELVPLPHTPYFQPKAQNSYAGGVSRAFAPVRPQISDNPFLRALAQACFACLPMPDSRRQEVWEVHLHQMRIVATSTCPGLPAPEGAHQDGTEFQTLHLLRRENVGGGETSIHRLDGAPLFRCTMRDVLDTLILEDPRVLHDVTPVVSATGTGGVRDILGIDFYYRPNLPRPASSRAVEDA